MKHPWYLYAILLRPAQIESNLQRIRDVGLVENTPNLWQIALGVLRMWHRIAARPESIGLAHDGTTRRSWRARLLKIRPLRFPFVLWEGSVVPGDLSGLGSSADRLITHMLGTYHDGLQFAYDYQILEAYQGAPAKLLKLAREVVDHPGTPRSRWLRDLVIFDGYHERLIDWVSRAELHGAELPPEQVDDPDISFHAYLDWCARQPETLAATWSAYRAGRFNLPQGVQPRAEDTAAPAAA